MSKHIPALDGLRGVAAWLVVVSHTNNVASHGWWFFGGAGAAGVMIFFALSGFLMGHLYAHRELDRSSAGRFAANRFDRVIPLYLVVVGLSYLARKYAWPIHSYQVNDSNLIQHLLLIKGENVLWTVPVETSFYALFVALWGLRSRSVWVYAAALFSLAILSIGTMYAALPTGHELPRYLIYFVGGLLVADVRRSGSIPRDAMSSYGGALLLLPCIVLLIPANYRALFGTGLGGYAGTAPLLLACGAVAMASHSELADRMLGSRFMSLQGQISYSVYLMHPIVLHTVRRHFQLDDFRLLLVTVAGTFVLAWLSSNTLEQLKPFRGLRALRRRRRGRSRMPVAGFTGAGPDSPYH